MSPSLCFLFLAIFLKNLVKSNLALPDCHQRLCGKITVPDPFAIGKGCGINPDLELLCDQLSYPPVLKLANSPEMEVTQIFITPRTLKVNMNLSVLCEDTKEIRSLDSPVFTFSPTKNKFIALGCDVSFSILQPDTDGLLHGCTSYCSRESSTVQSQCCGHGCCQTTLPDGVSESYSWRINTLNTERQSIKSWCNYGVIVSDDFTDFKELRKIDSKYHSLPAELDWIVKNTTCIEAMKNRATFACKDENSKCIDAPKGYSCICLKGYEGTPFELHGCKKIDICRDPSQNPCVKSSTCLKKRGGAYLCSCPFFYFGDGKKEGSGCYFGYHIILIVLLSIKVAVILYFVISYMIKKKKKRERERTRHYNYRKNGGDLLEERLWRAGVSCSKFSIEEIRKITDDFSSKRVIGNGGSGTVFKGILADGEDVAVKKSQEVGERHINDFINEIVILAQLRERNIVRLIGYCFDDQCPILVYEYVSNGTLSKHIHEDDLPPLAWMERISIAAEVACALAYLHYGVSAIGT